jgi:threonine dehydrogenase-like Zn-dependent dehydrogenase
VEVFDYKDPECGKKIREYTKNGLKYAWDCVGTPEAAETCAEALTSEPGIARYGTILGPKFPRDDVTYTGTLAYRGTGEDFVRGGKTFTDNQKHADFQSKWWDIARTLLAAGRVRTHPVSLRPNGLEGVIEGLNIMKEGKYSAEKLVYKVSETP